MNDYGSRISPGSLQELAAQLGILQNIDALVEKDAITGGQGGRFMDYQRQKGNTEAAQNLANFIQLSNAYPNVQPPRQLQQSTAAMFGNPYQQMMGAYNLPSGAPNLIPNMSPFQAKTEAEIGAFTSQSDAQINSMQRTMDRVGIPKEDQPSYLMQWLSGNRTGGLTDLQNMKMRAVKSRLLSQIDQGILTDSAGIVLNTAEPSEQQFRAQVSALAAAAGIDPNDADIQDALTRKYAKAKASEGSGVGKTIGNIVGGAVNTFTPWGLITGNNPTVKGAIKGIKKAAPSLMKWLNKNPRNEAFIRRMRSLGATDQEIQDYLTNRETE